MNVLPRAITVIFITLVELYSFLRDSGAQKPYKESFYAKIESYMEIHPLKSFRDTLLGKEVKRFFHWIEIIFFLPKLSLLNALKDLWT